MLCFVFVFFVFISLFFFFNDTATTEIYTLSLHDALPISLVDLFFSCAVIVILNVGTQVADRCTRCSFPFILVFDSGHLLQEREDGLE